jgi:hypothetical protein
MKIKDPYNPPHASNCSTQEEVDSEVNTVAARARDNGWFRGVIFGACASGILSVLLLFLLLRQGA